MAELITVPELKLQARIDTSAEDSLLQIFCTSSSSLVLGYVTDDTAAIPPEVLKHAALVLASYMYRERDGSNEYAVPERFGYGYLPAAVTALLYPYRRPTFA